MPKLDRLCLMTVHAHPDDEVIQNGGTLLRYADEGVATVLVCCTGGEEGEIVDPEMDPVAVKPILGEVRRRELESAAQMLKIGALEWLGYRDSGMAGTPENDNPTCFHQADLGEATTRLVRLIRRHRPHVLVSYNAQGGYGHPDHIKAYAVTKNAFERAGDAAFDADSDQEPWQPLKLYEITIPLEHLPRLFELMHQLNPERFDKPDSGTGFKLYGAPLAEITTILDVARYGELKKAALRCHRTQIPPDSFFYKTRPPGYEDLEHGEYFVRVKSLVSAPEHENDLFAGLRAG